jgi:hypothetical protein
MPSSFLILAPSMYLQNQTPGCFVQFVAESALLRKNPTAVSEPARANAGAWALAGACD